LADQFLRRGLDQFPHDPELMHMAARQDIARGDYDTAERELRSALLALHEHDTSASETASLVLPNVRQNADISSGGHDDSGKAANYFEPAPLCRPEPARGAVSEGRIRPIALTFLIPVGQSQQNGQNAGTSQQAAQGQAQGAGSSQETAQELANKQQREEQMQDEVEALENRNTPLMTTGGVGTGRIGDPGIDRLIVGDSLLGGAYTESNEVRFGIEAHGVYAYSGTPDGSSNLPFGTLPAHALFGEQSKVGYAGLAQLSTNTLGVAVGTSPQGFAVHNLIGGVRYRPLNRWFTLLGVRDSVKDSLLSYAGARDPGTGVRWGGVVSNTGTIKFDSAPATGALYKKVWGICLSQLLVYPGAARAQQLESFRQRRTLLASSARADSRRKCKRHALRPEPEILFLWTGGIFQPATILFGFDSNLVVFPSPAL
jgi:Cellulose synthase operon protein C C-terminus (BCSC_C)